MRLKSFLFAPAHFIETVGHFEQKRGTLPGSDGDPDKRPPRVTQQSLGMRIRCSKDTARAAHMCEVTQVAPRLDTGPSD